MPTNRPNGTPTWIELFTSDPDASRAFYGELFGWAATDPVEEFGGYANFLRDGDPIAGVMRNDRSTGTPDTWSVYLSTDDVDAVAAAVPGGGGQILSPPMTVGDLGRMAILADAGGAMVGAWQPGQHTGFAVTGEPGSPGWFELHTRDYAASIEFFQRAFGCVVETASDIPEFRYTTIGAGEDQVAGIMDASGFLPEGVPAHWSVYFQVDDADAAIAKAVELGATVVLPAEDTPYGRLAQLVDPTGAGFKLIQNPPTAP